MPVVAVQDIGSPVQGGRELERRRRESNEAARVARVGGVDALGRELVELEQIHARRGAPAGCPFDLAEAMTAGAQPPQRHAGSG